MYTHVHGSLDEWCFVKQVHPSPLSGNSMVINSRNVQGTWNVWMASLKVTGYISGWGNHAWLDSAYLTRRNSQTSQIGPGERPRMYTMQTAITVEDSSVHAEIRWSTPTPTSCQIAQQLLTLQAQPTCSGRVTIASSDWWKLFSILHVPSIWEKLGKTFAKSHFNCKDCRINMEWRTLKGKASVSPFLWSRTSF